MQEEQFNHPINNGQQISCPNNRPVRQFCYDRDCEQPVYSCRQQSCDCIILHRDCRRYDKQCLKDIINRRVQHQNDLNISLKKKLKKSKLRLQQIQKFLNKGMNIISDEYIGLSQYEEKFLRIIQKGHQQGITKQQIAQIHNDSQNFIIQRNYLQHYVDYTDLHLNNLTNSLYDLQNTFKNKLKLNSLMITSQIVTSQQMKKIEDFFYDQGQTIRNLTLLYRASQHEFSAQKFHQYCDGQTNTLTICQNQFDKKIGGFTPVSWSSQQQQIYYDDLSRSSFVFNLTNGHKFKPQKATLLVCSSIQQGPYFGNGDFKLSDHCNINNQSSCELNESFYNSNYQSQQWDSNQQMTGSVYGRFAVKQYQVWKVEFQPKQLYLQQKQRKNQPKSQKQQFVLTPTPTGKTLNPIYSAKLVTKNPDLDNSSQLKQQNLQISLGKK